MQRFILCVAVAATLVSAQVATAQAPPLRDFVYTAQTAQPARQQGDVAAGGINWACQGQTCMTRGPWPQPGLPACRALAALVGPITSYGRPGAALSAADITTCNAGQSAAAAQPRVLPGVSVPITPAPRLRPVSRASSAVTIDVPEMALAGGAMVAAPDRAGPSVMINVGELVFGGGAAVVRPDIGAPPVVVNAPELAFEGR